jgi:hypothetical protein
MRREGAAGLWSDGTQEHSMFESRPMIKEYGILVPLRPCTIRFMRKTIELGNLTVICLMTLFGAVVSTSE